MWSADGSYSLAPNADVVATTSDFSVNYLINSKGFRDKEYSYDKPQNMVRFAVFGDSFTFGEGVLYGKRFTDIPEDKIKGIEVLDFGVPGAGLDDVISNILTEGLKYNPDYIVVVLNRLEMERINPDISGVLNYTATEGGKVKGASSQIPDTANLKRDNPFFNYQPNFILRNSYLASYIYYKYSVYKLKSIMQKYDQSFWSQFLQSENSIESNNNNDLQASKATLLFDKLSTACIKPKCNLIVINIDTEPLNAFYGTPQFKYYDLSSDLQKESSKYRLTFKYDQHYNVKTNYFLGQKFIDIFQQLIGK